MGELRVVFSPGEGAGVDPYRARLTDAAGAWLGTEVSFAPFLEDSDYEDLRWYLEEYMELPDGGAVTRAQRIETRLDEWGRRLYYALFADAANAASWRDLLATPAPRQLTLATSDPALLRLPWELMTDTAGAIAQRVSVRRQLPEPGVPHATQEAVADTTALPLRVLYVVSRPDDTGFIDPRFTSQAMLDALDPLGVQVRVDFCRPSTLARMEELLSEARHESAPYHLVHFDGHGAFLPEAEIGALCFEKADDGTGSSQTDLVRADRLGTLLADHRIPLVVLEACRSGTLKTLVFRSVAPRLIRAGVGSVLSMSHAVHVEAARVLLDRFYRELVLGASIGHAVAAARKSLVSSNERWIEYGPGGRRITLRDWFLPHLYQRGDDHPMLPPVTDEANPARLFDVFLSHNHADSARVEALARTLIESHGLRVWLDKWEGRPGPLEPQCARGLRDSRFTVVVGSQAALDSRWVRWEIDQHTARHPEGDRLLPLKMEPLQLPPDLDDQLWVDFTDPTADGENAARLAQLIRGTDAEDARRKRGFRGPADAKRGEPGAFPPPPQFGFRGRARELHRLERRLRRTRGLVLHAMGGMGKTALAGEAARWWTRTGLFGDGACFLSFERPQSAESVVRALGTYLMGPKFEQLPTTEQRRRVGEEFQRRAVLFVWDNFESTLPQFAEDPDEVGVAAASPYTDVVRTELAELFRELTTGAGRGCVLVTCRPGRTFLDAHAGHFELSGLARADSLWLLSEILERHGLSLSDPNLPRVELDPLLDDLADHPLSLELVGPHLTTLAPAVIRADFAGLLTTFAQEAGEERNSSLLASLEFSKRHLSEAARAALPWLGLFQGGVFEQKLLEVSGLDPVAWEPLRTEFQAIALLHAEQELRINKRPFLRYHPTLAAAARDPELAAQPETRERFVGAYLTLMGALDKALRGSQSRAALAILDREEPNYRRAVRWAVSDGRLGEAADLGETLSRYLQSSGRLRERDAWVAWLHGEVGKGGFTKEAADYERQQAWSRFTTGDPQGAITQLQDLIAQLEATTEFDPAFLVALTKGMLARVLLHSGASGRAIPVLRKTVTLWEALVEKKAGCDWKSLMASGETKAASGELGNLSATLGDLANALSDAGQHQAALQTAEAGVEIDTARGAAREEAAGHAQCASILMAAGRFAKADARYDRALTAAREVGDQELIGATLQHQGALARRLGQLERATGLYRQALVSFQQAGAEASEMRTYNLLGVTEQKAGRLGEARSWYEKSRELAEHLQDLACIGQAAQNLGIVLQEEGEAALAQGDEATARKHFEQARLSLEDSLKAKQTLGSKPGEALAWSQLATVHLLLGDFDAAERHAHAALENRESLGLLEARWDCNTLARIAEVRGDQAAAAEWARKRDALLAEAERRARGEGPGPGVAHVPDQLLQALTGLGVACLKTGFDASSPDALGPEAEEVLAQLDNASEPLPTLAAHFRALAGRRLPPIPSDLPASLRNLLQQLHDALE